jgi:hypothetical protein
MLLITPAKKLKSNQVSETHISRSSESIKNYIHLRYSQEKKLKAFKEIHKIKVDDVYQSLMEGSISPRRVTDSIKFAKNHDNIQDLSDSEFLDHVFEIITASINHHYSLSRYSEQEDFIKKCITVLGKLNLELKSYKLEHSYNLSQALSEVREDSVPTYMITSQYTAFKASITIFELEARGDLETFRNQEFQNVTNSMDILFTEVFEEIVSSQGTSK